MKKRNQKSPAVKRNIDLLAEEKFGGDVGVALTTMLDNGESIEQYISELNKDEAGLVLDWIDVNVIDAKMGGKEKFQQDLIDEFNLTTCLDTINMTKEEVYATEINPFTKHLVKHIILLVGGIALILLLSYFFKNENFELLLSTFIGIEALTISSCIMKILKFKKAKKIIERMEAEKE